MNVWKCGAQQKHTGHNALVNDYRRRNSLQAALSSHHIRKCYINEMDGPCGPPPQHSPHCHQLPPHYFNLCGLAGGEPKGGEGGVNSAILIKKGVTVAAKAN